MKILDVSKVSDGQVLGRSVFDADGKITVPSGTTLSSDLINDIRKSGLTRIYLFDDDTFSEAPEERIKDYVKGVIHLQTALEINKKYFRTDTSILLSPKNVRKHIKEGRKWLFAESNEKKLKYFFSLVESVIERNHDFFIVLPENNFDEDEANYLISALLLAGGIALEMDFTESEITQIILSALNHNIGYLLFKDYITGDFNSLSPDIKTLIQDFPVFSTIMLMGCDPGSTTIQRLIQYHHKRKNGTGCPPGIQLPKEDIFNRFTLARDILSVSVEYCELIYGRMGKDKLSPFKAITQLYHLGEEMFNSNVLRLLSRLLQLFPEGCYIRIRSNSSGRYVGFSGIIKEVDDSEENILVKSILLTKNALGEDIDPKVVDVSGERHLLLE